MTEYILDSVEKAVKGSEDVMKTSITLKKDLRILIAYLRNLHDEEITGKSIEGLDKILEKKTENKRNLQEISNLCDEYKNTLDELDNTRANKGRKF